MKKLIAGNWKMNGTAASAKALAEAVMAGIGSNPMLAEACDFVVCPPAPLSGHGQAGHKRQRGRVGRAGLCRG